MHVVVAGQILVVVAAAAVGEQPFVVGQSEGGSCCS